MSVHVEKKNKKLQKCVDTWNKMCYYIIVKGKGRKNRESGKQGH